MYDVPKFYIKKGNSFISSLNNNDDPKDFWILQQVICKGIENVNSIPSKETSLGWSSRSSFEI